MKLTHRSVYTIELDSSELNLLRKALRGEPLNEVQDAKAADLERSLANQKVKAAQHLAKSAERLDANLKASQ